MIKGHQDGSLSFRRSCAHGVCGSDAMRINGRNLLACKVLVQDLGTPNITIEPLLGLKVIKDMVVDMEPFFEHYRSVLPFLNQRRTAARRRQRAAAEPSRPRAFRRHHEMYSLRSLHDLLSIVLVARCVYRPGCDR